MKSIIEFILSIGILGGGLLGVITMFIIVSALIMCIPASIIYLLLLYLFNGVYFAPFLNIWGICILIKVLSGLLLGVESK